MNRNLCKKGLVLGIIFLFVGAGVVPSISGDNSNFGNILYVDDDNTEGPWDGTQEHPYQYIQDGIDAASDGDTVYVYSGTYYENVKINKSNIKLEGENRNTVIIDGGRNGDVIRIPSTIDNIYEKIRIQKFTIQNGDQNGIFNQFAEDVQFSQCIIKNNTYGIRFWHTTGGEIYQNIISNNDYGIFLEFADHLSIDRNCIHNDHTGILCDTSDSIDISHNDIRHCNRLGIYILRGIDSKNVNNINKNNFIDNNKHASFKKHRIGDCKNKWNGNYWDNLPSRVIGIKPIQGVWEFTRFDLTFPWIQIDWRCSKEPYEIECS